MFHQKNFRELSDRRRMVYSDVWIKKVSEALGVNVEECSRIIIDARAGEFLKIYVEKFGADRMLNIDVSDVKSANITILDKGIGE